MRHVDNRSAEAAYLTKPNILYPGTQAQADEAERILRLQDFQQEHAVAGMPDPVKSEFNARKGRIRTADAALVTTAIGTAANDTFTQAGHGLRQGERIVFTALAGGTGLSVGVIYFVANPGGSSFQLAATNGGAVIDFSTDVTSCTYVRLETASTAVSRDGLIAAT